MNTHLTEPHLLLDSIGSDSPGIREDAAETAAFWGARFGADEATDVVRALAVAAARERDARVRESQLNAILEIGESQSITPESVRALGGIDPAVLDDEQREYLATIRPMTE